MSKLKTRDLEWYFFSFLDKKYGNGARTNRATEKGYWKTTGKDRPVYHKRQIVGMKKTLVYHCGRAPKGKRSNWVMHEYRLAGSELETAGAAKDAFVVCRIFQKSGSGPKNGEQYGAPFVEEEWENDGLASAPQNDSGQEIDFGDHAYLDSDDLEQILGSDVPLNMTPVSSDGSHDGEAANSFGGTQNPFESASDAYSEPKMCYDQNMQNLPASFDMEAALVKQEGLGECSKPGNSDIADDLNFLLNEPFLDSFENFPTADEGFIEANDLSNPFETNAAGAFDMLAEYLDAGDDSSLYYGSDPAMVFGNEDLASNQTLLPQMNVSNGTEQAMLPSGQLFNNNFDATFSPDKQGSTQYQPDFQYPYIKQASRMLGNIHAPPAYAAEFPSKDAIRRLNSVARSPSSLHVSASTIQIRNVNVSTRGSNRSSSKQENFNIVLSFGFSRGDDGSSSLESSVRIVPGKTVSAISRGLLCFIFFGILLLSMMSFRFGNFIGVK